MYVGLLHLHSYLPIVLFIMIFVVLLNSLRGWITKTNFDKYSNLFVLISMIVIHIQWTVGAILYFVSPNVKSMSEAMGDSLSRLYALEHPLLMTVALVLVTIARSKSKKSDESKHHKMNFIFFALALACILLCLPPSWL